MLLENHAIVLYPFITLTTNQIHWKLNQEYLYIKNIVFDYNILNLGVLALKLIKKNIIF